MDDKDFEKLERNLELKEKELNDLKKIYFQETGQHYEDVRMLTPLCPTCSAPMEHVRPGQWQCVYCEGGEHNETL